MRETARGLLIKDGGLVLIHRIKQKEGKTEEYYVIPGGKIENGESYEDTVQREMMEELGINVKPVRLLYKQRIKNEIHNYFLCEFIDGELGTGKGPEFNNKEYYERGVYLPEVIPLNEIYKINLQEPLKTILQQDIKRYGGIDKIVYKEI